MKEIPDRSLEAMRVRDELSHDADALRALDAIAKKSEEEAATEIPPLPDDLRSAWGQRYGEAQKAVTPVPEKMGFFEKLTSHWSRAALGGLAGASLALVAVLFVFNQTSPPNPNDSVVLRGGGDFTPTKETAILYLASDSVSFAQFSETRSGGVVLEVTDEQDALRLISENKISEAVLLDARTGTVRLWKDGYGEETLLLEKGDVFDLSEALEIYLGQ